MLRRLSLAIGGESEAAREASHWARPSRGAILNWQEHPTIRRHINRRVSGDPEVNWVDYAAERLFGEGLDEGLNLGCGSGRLEEHALSIGLLRRFHSIDISEGAVEEARGRLGEERVRFEVGDANEMELPEGAYDVAFAAGSLHHFTELEHVLDQVGRSLRPGGYFVFDEYVGPSNFQWSDRRLDVINRLLAEIPPGYRRDLRSIFRRKRRVYRPPLDESRRDSPFEAVRSEDILPLVRERFEVVVERGYGGAVLHQLLDGIAGNFDPGSDRDRELLKKLIRKEMELEEAGEVGSDFAFVLARKKEGP